MTESHFSFDEKNAFLMSIKPHYADMIIAGTKKIELRRILPTSPIGWMVIYASAPVQKIVGMVKVVGYAEAKPANELWDMAEALGCGVTEADFEAYFKGVPAKALLLSEEPVQVFSKGVSPERVIEGYIRPPQSFQYISYAALQRLQAIYKVEQEQNCQAILQYHGRCEVMKPPLSVISLTCV